MRGRKVFSSLILFLCLLMPWSATAGEDAEAKQVPSPEFSSSYSSSSSSSSSSSYSTTYSTTYPTTYPTTSSYWPSTTTDSGPRSCYFGSEIISDGEVVDSITEGCLQLRCEDGNITKHYYDHPGACGCCMFDGDMYANGAELPGFCWKVVCQNSTWVFNGCVVECCGHCTVHTDPHFVTFDGHTYDFHGTCNHTLAQTQQYLNEYNNNNNNNNNNRKQRHYFQPDEWAYYPGVGVYSDFKPCYGGASCLDKTTFTDNPHSVITMYADSVYTLGVNGNSFVVPATGVHQVAFPDCGVYHPVLAFQYHGCVVLLGSSRITVMSCPYRVDVWAHPSLQNSLNGLCGLYTRYQRDDFTDRFNHIHPLQTRPSNFSQTWLTADQVDEQCKWPCVFGGKGGKGCTANLQTLADDACIPTDPSFKKSREYCCEQFDDLVDCYLLDSCAHDICVMRLNGNSQEAQEGWIWTLQLNAITSQQLLESKECSEEPPKRAVKLLMENKKQQRK